MEKVDEILNVNKKEIRRELADAVEEERVAYENLKIAIQNFNNADMEYCDIAISAWNLAEMQYRVASKRLHSLCAKYKDIVELPSRGIIFKIAIPA